jgi:signal transduction histidine kinase
VNTSLRREIAERRRIEAERARLYTRLVVAEEEERRRIARELHDQLGQQLTALRLTLETLKGLERDDLVRQVESLQELARQLDQDVAFRVWELTPTVLNTRGLGAALNEYIATWSKRFRIHAEVRVPEVSPALPSELMATIYRSAQEVLNNVVKHAHATRVDVVLEPAPDHVTLIVEDNGVGFDPHDRGERRGFGLIGMRERAALVGGDFQVESAPGRGTSVRLRVPTLAADAVDTAQR